MNYLEKPNQKLKQEIRQLPKTVTDVIIINSPNLIRQVKARWIIGKSVNGGRIGEYRSPDYKAYKLMINPSAGGYVDLMLTGSLVENLIVKPLGNTAFEMLSTDSKYDKLSKKYGKQEFGLSDDEWAEFSYEISHFILQDILEKSYELL